MKEKIWTVYTISLQGKVMYVGKTYRFVQRKWYHLNKRGTRYSCIPEKIDLSLITIDAIDTFTNEEEALKFEGKLILKYQTLSKLGGWNKQRSGLIKSGNLKEYNRLMSKKFRDENPDKIKEYSHKHYENNKDKILEKSHLYRQIHKEELRIKDQKYREEHREERIEYQREYWEKNKDSINKKRREHRKYKKLIIINNSN